MSFMKMLNSSGPKIEPYEMPTSTFSNSRKELFILER